MIKLEKALSIANDCISIARKENAKPIAVVVLNSNGNIVVALKEDDASIFRNNKISNFQIGLYFSTIYHQL